ncbi:MAG: FHA domain-containing protein [Atopobiaceae bacterium]|nr:FHA domain-containing protein [Atopobiaceae bacterium]MBR1830161.1 FHA domain-containing protein [Atopobiaceae bacterium]
MLDDSASMGLDIVPVDFLDDNVSASQLSVPEVEVPLTQRRVPAVEAPSADDDLPAEEAVPSFLLVDHQSGRTYRGTGQHVVIGRERMHCDIVFHDPNISRRHAELTFDEASGTWFVRDLGSTNGTLVNDVDVAQCQLHDGDLITLGLMNLEFREAS